MTDVARVPLARYGSHSAVLDALEVKLLTDVLVPEGVAHDEEIELARRAGAVILDLVRVEPVREIGQFLEDA